MKKLILIILLVLMCIGTAWAMCRVDYRCVTDCINMGYTYGVCKRYCTICD